MSDEEICKMMGWPKRAAEVLADNPDGLLSRICAVVREAERREREAWPRLDPVITWLENGCDPAEAAKELRIYAAAIRARGSK